MLKLIEGFELVTTTNGLTAKNYLPNNLGSVSIASGRNSGQCLQAASSIYGPTGGIYTANYSNVSIPINSNLSSGVIGFAFKSTSEFENNPTVLCTVYDSSDFILFSISKKNGYLYLYQPFSSITTDFYGSSIVDNISGSTKANGILYSNGASWVSLADSSQSGTTLTDGNWYYLEMKFVLGSGGYFIMSCNQKTIFTYSPTNFSPSGTNKNYNNLANKIVLGLSPIITSGIILPFSTSSVSNQFDDLYICDLTGSKNNNFLGGCYVIKSQPNSITQTNFTGNGATPNYNCVNENDPDSDNAYLYSSTYDKTDVYGMTALNQTGSIFGVSLNICAEQALGSGIITPVSYNSGTIYPSSSITYTTTYKTKNTILESNPANSADWNQTTYNATNFGIKYLSS